MRSLRGPVPGSACRSRAPAVAQLRTVCVAARLAEQSAGRARPAHAAADAAAYAAADAAAHAGAAAADAAATRAATRAAATAAAAAAATDAAPTDASGRAAGAIAAESMDRALPGRSRTATTARSLVRVSARK